MKFLDKNGGEHTTYLGAVFGTVSNKLSNFLNSKLPGCKEVEDMEEGYSMEDNGIYNEEWPYTPAPDVVERDNIFIPGTTPKVKCNKNHKIKIDYDNHQLVLEDEDGKVIHTTNIDGKLLANCTTKDLINMVYDINLDEPKLEETEEE